MKLIKSLLLFFFLIILSSLVLAINNTDPNLVSWWAMNDSSGNILDYVGSHHLNATGTISYQNSSINNFSSYSVYFDGASYLVQTNFISDLINENNDSVSILFFLKQRETEHYVVGTRDSSTGGFYYYQRTELTRNWYRAMNGFASDSGTMNTEGRHWCIALVVNSTGASQWQNGTNIGNGAGSMEATTHTNFAVGTQADSFGSGNFVGHLSDMIVLNRSVDEVDIKSFCTSGISIQEQANNAPTQNTPVLNATTVFNLTNENLTVYLQNVADIDGDNITNITDWRVNGSSIAVLNLPFEGGSNSSHTRDYSSYNYTVNVSGAVWNSTGGSDGFGAYEFDGISNNLKTQDILSLTELSSCIRTKIQSFGGGGNGNIYNDGTQLFWMTDTNDRVQITHNGGSGNQYAYSDINSITLNKEYHVCYTRNDNGTTNIYIDGLLNGEANQSAGTPIAGTTDLYIGNRLAGDRSLNGSLSELTIYNRTLTPQQIKALFENRTDIIVSQETRMGDNWSVFATPNDGTEDGITKESNGVVINFSNVAPSQNTPVLNGSTSWNYTDENLTVYLQGVSDTDDNKQLVNITDWRVNGSSIAGLNLPFEGGSNSTYTRDYSSYNNTVFVNGAVWNSTGGSDGFGAYEFNGINTSINVSNLFSGGKYFSMGARIKANSLLASDSAIIWIEGVAWQSCTMSARDNMYRVYCYNNSANYSIIEYDRTTPALNTYTDIYLTYDGTLNRDNLKLYVNGSQVKTGNLTGILRTAATITTIGKRGASDTLFFNGSIDDVRIYNRTLTPQQILSIHNNQSNIIVSQETIKNDNWSVVTTINDRYVDSSSSESNGVVIKAVPTVTLNLPYNNDHDNITLQNFTYNVTAGYPMKNCTLWTNITGVWNYNNSNTSSLSNVNTNGITTNLGLSGDGHYLWNVKCYDENGKSAVNGRNFTYVLDTLQPGITWINPTTHKINSTNITIQANVSDNNLYRVNLSLFNSSDGYVWNTFYDLINVTVFELNEPSNISQADQNFSIEICGSDDHTDGVMPKKGKKGESHLFFKSTDDVQLSEVKISFVEKDNKATDTPGDLITTYKDGDEWDINFSVIKPETKIVFNVSSSHKIIDRSYKGIDGHLVWGEFFHDFSVAKTFLVNGEPRTASLQTTRLDDFNYQIIWTPDIALLGGDTIFIDPLSGGLNINCNNRTVAFDDTPPAITLITPENNNVTINSLSLNLTYSVSDTVKIMNCTTYVNNASIGSNNTIIKNTNHYISFTGTHGSVYTWDVNCTDEGGLIGNSLTYTFNISSPPSSPGGGGLKGGGAQGINCIAGTVAQEVNGSILCMPIIKDSIVSKFSEVTENWWQKLKVWLFGETTTTTIKDIKIIDGAPYEFTTEKTLKSDGWLNNKYNILLVIGGIFVLLLAIQQGWIYQLFLFGLRYNIYLLILILGIIVYLILKSKGII